MAASETYAAEDGTPKTLLSSGTWESTNASSRNEQGLTRSLRVIILSARGLRNADNMPGQGVSDPFCTCAAAGRPGAMVKTRTVQDSLDPVWHHEDELIVCAQGDDVLEFTVWDKDLVKQDDLLGRAELAVSPAHMFFDGELKLRGEGCEASYLRVKVSEAAAIEGAVGTTGALQAEAAASTQLPSWRLFPRRKSSWPSLSKPPLAPSKLTVATDTSHEASPQASPASSGSDGYSCVEEEEASAPCGDAARQGTRESLPSTTTCPKHTARSKALPRMTC